MKKKLAPKVKCVSCGNNLVNIYLAQTGGNKKPIGLFCVQCDFPRQPEEWFIDLKYERIKRAEEKRKHYNFDNKIHCPYCNETNYKKNKDEFIYSQYPIYKKDQKTIKRYVEKKINKIMTYHCNNPKHKSESHKGNWRVNEPLI